MLASQSPGAYASRPAHLFLQGPQGLCFEAAPGLGLFVCICEMFQTGRKGFGLRGRIQVIETVVGQSRSLVVP